MVAYGTGLYGTGLYGPAGAAGLAIDGSTPAAVSADTGTITTASFTAPAGALLVAFAIGGTPIGTFNPGPLVSDSGNLAWRLEDATGASTAVFGDRVTVWWAATTSSAARTVSLTCTVNNTYPKFLRVVVFTGAWTAGPYGPIQFHAPGEINGAVIPAVTSYTALQAGAWGWTLYDDFHAGAVPAAGAGCTLDSSVADGQITAAVYRRTSTSAASGDQVTVSTATGPPSGVATWLTVEILPAPQAAVSTDVRPQAIVECAFTTDPNGPNAGNPVWVDITRYVRMIDAQRSNRTWEYAAFEAGELSLTLDNRDGRFTPGNTASPYYPNVKLYRPIRFRALYPPTSGGSYPLWYGYVERWPQKWNDPAWGETNLQATDALANLSQIDLDAAYPSEVFLDGPIAYYQCNEPSDSTQAGNTAVDDQLSVPIATSRYGTGDTVFGGSEIVIDGGTSLTLNPTAGTGLGDLLDLSKVQGIFPSTATGWTFEMWAMSNAGTPGTYSPLFCQLVEASGLFSGFNIIISRTFLGQVSLQSGTNVIWDSPAAYWGAGPMHFVITLSTTGVVNFYVNTPDGTPNYTGSPTLFGDANVCVIGGNWYINRSPTNVFRGFAGEIAVYDYALTGARAAAHFVVGRNGGFVGETTGERASRILNFVNWPVNARAIQLGLSVENTTLLGIGGESALSALQNVATDEAGALWIDALGQVVFEGRNYRPQLLTPTMTFDPTSSPPVPYDLGSFAADYDPAYVYNDIAITRTGGVFVTAGSQTSQQEYFPRALAEEINVGSDDDASDRANGFADRYAEPQPRLQDLAIDLFPGPITSIPGLLALNISSRVVVNHRPLQPGGPIIFDGFVDGLHHQVDPDRWQVGALISPRFADYWLLAAQHTTVHTAAGIGATTLTLDALPDAATNTAAQSWAVNVAPNSQTNSYTVIGSHHVLRGGAYIGSVVVKNVGATTVGYTTFTVTLNAATSFAVNVGDVICDRLPPGDTDPTVWDSRSILGSTTKCFY